ncbi:tRNA lysidine(34) synthetase TilS [Candidatus Dependentiae bacterium]|nr:MAG: tRNA lysidine(34) synthetase TilS [Candidatus Dependentiae bacterium]
MHNLIVQQIWNFIQKHKLLPPGSRVILGLSGGPDSVFLLHFLADLAGKNMISLIAAHLDHEWRAESTKDALFCQTIAQTIGIKFISTKASELNLPFKREGSLEELGRKIRRYFFEKVCAEEQANCIALAHHLQDQEETFFIRLLRGTTLTGLTGMWPKYGLYIRPLLETNKNDIIHYLESHGISYLIDPTNIEKFYLRNRIRNTVIPTLQETDKRFDVNFLKTIHHLQKAEKFLEQLTQETFAKVTQQENGKCILLLTSFFQLDPFLQKRVILHWLITEKVPFKPSEGLLNEILRFVQGPDSKKHQIHRFWILVKRKNQLSIVHI